MAGAFNLTAQLNLQGPGNVKQVIGKIRQELGDVKTNINLTLNKNSAKAVGDVTNRLRAMNNVLVTSKTHVNDLNKSFQQLSASLGAVRNVSSTASNSISNVNKVSATSAQQIKEAANSMEAFGKQSFLAVKRFAAFSIVTTGIYGLVNAIQSGFTAFIELDRQLIRLQQVTNSGSLGIRGLSDEITNLAKNFGVSSAGLAEVAVTLAQAGLTARQTKEALGAIAKTDLSPTFDSMTETTEGAIAAMSQFNIAASELEGTLARINAVSAAFAVESSDIIKAIQRAGSVFASSSKGVSTNTEALNEFIAVFTAVRSTTRESAETIATGLRTIFTRIQRPQTIEFLRTYGVELTDLTGKFVGPYEAARRLSEVLGKLDPRDLRFGQIVEELGGFRQINKVIPILQNFSTAQKALDVARKGGGSLAKDQAVAELSLAVQLAKVREEFLALIKAVGQSKTFQTFFTITTLLTRGLIGLAAAFKPILPALAILGTLKLGKAAIDFGGGFLGSFKKGGGSGAAGTTLGQTVTGSKTKEVEETKALSREAMKSNTNALTNLTSAINNLNNSVTNLAEEIATSPTVATKNQGGKILAFARGGVVPGSGNRDTVPAMLQPGEFVIRKKAVETIGTNQLHSMNKYADGGYVKEKLPEAEAALQEQAVSYNGINDLKINNSGKGAIRGYMFENYVGQEYGVNAPDQKFPDIPDASPTILKQLGLSRSKGSKGSPIKHVELKYRSGLQPEFQAPFTEENTAVVYAIEKKLGGKIQKFMAGGVAELSEEQRERLSGTELAALAQSLGGASNIRGAVGGQDVVKKRLSEVKESTPTTWKKLFDKRFLESDDSIPFRSVAQELLELAESKRAKRVFSEEEKANAIRVGLAGLFPFDVNTETYEEIGDKILQIQTRTLPKSKAPEIAKIRQEIDEVIGRGTRSLYGKEPLTLDDTTKESLGLGNLEGYMIEAILAKAGANPGKLDDRSVDFPTGLDEAAGLFGIDPNIPTEIKRDVKGGYSKAKANFRNYFAKMAAGGLVQLFQDGGNAEKEQKNYGKIGLKNSGSEIMATYLKNKEREGFVSAKKTAGQLYTIGLSKASKGYGPRLYDIVMEAVTANGGMLTSDRNQVSDAAQSVWSYYFNNRPDVKHIPLEKNQWTKNTSYIDPRLLGPEKDWPPANDPAWILQSGYSKDPNLINGPDIVDMNDPKYAKFLQNEQLSFMTQAVLAGNMRNAGGFIKFAKGGSAKDTVPALLTPGEFVINKKAASRIGYGSLNRLNKADKIAGYNKGGIVAGVQRFAGGGTAGALLPGGRELPDDPFGAKAADKALEALRNAAKQAGVSLSKMESSVKQNIVALAQTKTKEREQSRQSFTNDIIRTSSRGFGTGEIGEKQKADFEENVRANLSQLSGGSANPDEIAAAAKAIADAAAAGKPFADLMDESVAVLQPFRDAMDATKDSAAALRDAELQLADQLGGLTEAARATATELENANYVSSGQAREDFGLAGILNPERARELAASDSGQRLLGNARGILGGGAVGERLVGALDALPDGIAGPMKEAVDAIGGPSGAIAAGISLLGSNLPDLAKSFGLGDSSVVAGLGGALAEGGSRAVSMATLGAQIAGPLGGAIGLISGALSGAIDGVFKALRTQQLEDSMLALDKATQDASEKLETLTKSDTDANFQEAAKATDVLRDSITDLGAQASTGGTGGFYGAASGAIQGAGYGAIIGSIIPGLGTAIGAAIGGAIGVGVGLFTGSGDDEINEEAFQGQLKAIDSYISGMQQLAGRRINLQSLEDITKAIDDFNNAKTPEDKSALGARSIRVQEAQRAALLRSGADIKQSESVEDFVRSGRGGSEAKQTVAKASEDIAVAQAMQELNQLYAGNKEAIDRESANKKKLIARGYELIAEQENQQNQEARLAITMKEVNKQTEGLVEKFRKMQNEIQKFNDSLDMIKISTQSAAAAASGTATSTVDYRADERILANATAATPAEFEATLNRVSQLAGGGANANQLTDSLKAQRQIQGELPEILRGADQNDIQDVEKKLRASLTAGGVSGTALEETVSKITEKLSAETSGRQGKSFQELVEEFPALQAAMTGLEEANKTATELVKANNAAMSEYRSLLDQINEATRKQIDIQTRRDQLNLEYSQKLSEITGRSSDTRLDTPVTNRVNALTREELGIGTMDPQRIGEALREAIKERASIEERISSGDDTKENGDALAEQTNTVNNLTEALNNLADNTETTAQIMKEFQDIRRVTDASSNVAKELLTANPEDLYKFGQEQAALSAFQSNDPQMLARLKNPAAGAQAAQDIYAGFDKVSQFLPEADRKRLERDLTDQLYEARTGKKLSEVSIGGKTIGEYRKEEDQKAKELQEEQKRRDEALVELSEVQNQLKETFRDKSTELITALADLTTRLNRPLTFQQLVDRTSGATANGTSTTAAGSTNVAGNSFGGGAQAAAFRETFIAGQRKGNTSGSNTELVKAYQALMKTFTDDEKKLFEELKAKSPEGAKSIMAGFSAAYEIAIQRELAARTQSQTNSRVTAPATSSTAAPVVAQSTPIEAKNEAVRAMEASLAASRAALDAASGVPTPAVGQSPSIGSGTTTNISGPLSIDPVAIISNLVSQLQANPLPVKVVNVAEFKNNGTTVGGGAPDGLPSFFTITDDAKKFLSDFQSHISEFGGYVARLEAKTFPSVIQMQGRHTVEVRVTGAAAFESLKGDFANFIQEEIQKHMRDQWNKTGGALGSSGAGSRSVAPLQY